MTVSYSGYDGIILVFRLSGSYCYNYNDFCLSKYMKACHGMNV